MFIVHLAPIRVMHIIEILFGLRLGFGSLRQMSVRSHCYVVDFRRTLMAQSGAHRFAFVALLLLALPVVLTFHVLFALPRFAERKRQFCAFSLHPIFLPVLGRISFPVFVPPPSYQVPRLDCLACPVKHPLARQVIDPVGDLYQ